MPFLVHTSYRTLPYFTDSRHIADDFISWGYRVDETHDVEASSQPTEYDNSNLPLHKISTSETQTHMYGRPSSDPRSRRLLDTATHNPDFALHSV
ncbi:hypothetical protein K491DRAFT_423917 [Lophiostoma macrostomum CBS 122681]|uniref:Uncharacterized protein n=1 Tax=Lophiostoma macrostomum CBS 122681 TaxID=1314788 RepID=A0A6A6T8I0_9PLEO|nr:hypothetical protein K491DRAFT_423917 [Lophiostoma macrostomum CBS 122681]